MCVCSSLVPKPNITNHNLSNIWPQEGGGVDIWRQIEKEEFTQNIEIDKNSMKNMKEDKDELAVWKK